MKPQAISKPEWRKRRIRLDIALASIAAWLSFIVFAGTDSVLYQQLSIALIAGGVTLIGQYVFAATFDDKNYMNAIVKNNNQSTPVAADEEE